jgi:hypothetical protein
MPPLLRIVAQTRLNIALLETKQRLTAIPGRERTTTGLGGAPQQLEEPAILLQYHR